MVGCAAVVVWAVVTSARPGGEVYNAAGWGELGRFARALTAPRLDGDFLVLTLRATLTSVSYALVGTALAMTIGVVVGAWSSALWWSHGTGRSREANLAVSAIRVAGAVLRGTHEAIWALLLVFVLGRNPLVAILAIAIPFGAVSAKVVADIADDADGAVAQSFFDTRMRGAGRTAAWCYVVLPVVRRQLVSYGFYRLECALRSSVVLGAIGAGGLGFELTVSFSGSEYGEIWTLVLVLIALSLLLERWAAALRRHGSTTTGRRSSLIGIALTTALAIAWLRVNPLTLFDDRARRLAADFAGKAWPPTTPAGGWSQLWNATVDTVRLSVVAMVVAVAIGVPLSIVAARAQQGRVRRAAGRMVRLLLVSVRAIPPTIWAVLVLFVVFPGPLSGGIALGIYTAGVLGRLCAEAIETSDPVPANSLTAIGASPIVAFAYGTLPQVAPRFGSLSMYRWEVAARETVVVGLVGAGGLGRLIGEQKASFDEAAMLTSVIALILLSFAIDGVSRAARRVLR
jgi:phosphonate transport system permease protein